MRRHGWVGMVQLLVFIFSLLVPQATVRSDYWADFDNDGIPEQHGDDVGIDTDTDGLKDGFELYVSFTDPLNWDSDNDGCADGDEHHQNTGINYWYSATMNVQSAVTFADIDGDGVSNWLDSYPVDGLNGTGDRDGDGIWDMFDSYPDDFWNGEPHYNYNGTEYPGSWSDSDGDNIPDPADAYPNDSSNGNLITYAYVDAYYTMISGFYSPTDPTQDTDNDGIWDQFDPYPFDSTNNTAWFGEGEWLINGSYLWLSGHLYYAPNGGDDDGDGIPNSMDPYQNDPTNNTSWWSGGDFLVDGQQTFLSGHYSSSSSIADSDGDGILDLFDPYPFDASNNTAWWAGGDYLVNGSLTYYQGTYYAASTGDSDQDGIPNLFDLHPYEWDNNTFWWNGGNFYINGAESPFASGHYAGSYHSPSQDADYDGIPDILDPYDYDSSNNSFSWNGGTYWVNGQETYWSYGFYAGTSQDSDYDGIPDSLDAYANDASNNSSWWGGGDYTINNNTSWFNGQYFAGPWSDGDGDGIPDALDPYVADSHNGSMWTYDWSGNYWVDGVDTYLSGSYGSWESMSDSDGDGIYDVFDPYAYDAANNTAWWSGGSYWIDGNSQMFDSLPYAANSGNSDGDGDGIYDWFDPYAGDATNNTSFWSGGDFWVDGSYLNISGHYNTALAQEAGWDSDGDGIINALDPYASDAANNTSYFGGQYYAGYPFVGTHPETTAAWLSFWFDQPGNRNGAPLYLGLGLPDTDGDLIPDAMEEFFGLNKQDGTDASLVTGDSGYTHLERYLAWQDLRNPLEPLQYGQMDGLPNVWKVRYSLSLQDPDLYLQDPDIDGLPNMSEFWHGTNPVLPDTDGDGEDDGTEVNQGTNPKDRKSNRATTDSDGDGYTDDQENAAGTDPHDPYDFPNTVLPPPPGTTPLPPITTPVPLPDNVYLMSRTNSVSLTHYDASEGGVRWEEVSHRKEYFDSLAAAEAYAAMYPTPFNMDQFRDTHPEGGTVETAYISQYGELGVDAEGQVIVLSQWVVYIGKHVGTLSATIEEGYHYRSKKSYEEFGTQMPVEDIMALCASGEGYKNWSVINQRLAFTALGDAEKLTVPPTPASGIKCESSSTIGGFSASVYYERAVNPVVDDEGNPKTPEEYARFGVGGWKDIWMVRKPTPPVLGQPEKPEISYAFLRIKESVNAAGVRSKIGNPEPVRIVIPEGEDVSNVVFLHPVMGAGESVEERLIPVEVKTWDLTDFERNGSVMERKYKPDGPGASKTKIATELKIAQWESVITSTDMGGVLHADRIKEDRDAFFIRIDAPPPVDGTSCWLAKVWTLMPDGVTKDDTGADVELNEVPGSPGLYQSDGLCLVSDNEDDDHSGEIADGNRNDQTFRVKLGGTVCIAMYPKNAGTSLEPLIKLPVPVKKVLKYKCFILKDGTTSAVDAIDSTLAASHLAIAEKRLAQSGIKLEGVVSPVTSNPPGVVFKSGSNAFFDRPTMSGGIFDPLPAESKNLFDAPTLVLESNEVGVYFVSNFDFKDCVALATVKKGLRVGEKQYDRRILADSSENLGVYTIAHEFLHVLVDGIHPKDGSDFSDDSNSDRFLWSVNNGMERTGLTGRKRLTDNIVYHMLNSPLLQNP